MYNILYIYYIIYYIIHYIIYYPFSMLLYIYIYSAGHTLRTNSNISDLTLRTACLRILPHA